MRSALAAQRRGRRLDRAFDEAAAGLDERSRAFAREIAFGVVRWRGRLDALIEPHVSRGLASLKPAVRDVLRMGAYELLLLDGVPAYAAVSQAVDAVREAGQPRAAGLVNAVLRRVSERGLDASVAPRLSEDPAGHLSVWGSHPRWLIERWLRRWSVDEVARLVELDNTIPPLTLVPLDGEGEAGVSSAVERWQAAGFSAGPGPAGSGTVEVQGARPHEVLAAVPSFVQDPAAAWVCRYAAPPPGARIADLCAAPGGKAMNLARQAAFVLAADPSWPRLAQLAENRERTGLPLFVVQADAAAPPVRGADLVLIDAPCTGTGTLRRHPDSRWRLKPGDPAAMARVQGQLLDGAADAVAAGGLLVYSTCTLEQEENEGVVEAFLARRSDFTLEPPPRGAGPMPVDVNGLLNVRPQETGTDGAFAARLRRREGA